MPKNYEKKSQIGVVEPSGERRFLGGVKEAAEKLGVSVSSIYKSKKVMEVPALWAVKSGNRIVVCLRDPNGSYRELGTEKLVRATGMAKDVTEALYELHGENAVRGGEATRVKRIEGGYVWADGTVVGRNGKILSVQDDGSVCIGGRRVQVDRLVAEAFLPVKEGCRFVKHKDGNKKNCCAENLEWSEEGGKRSAMAVIRSRIDGRNAKVFASVREAAEDRGVSTQAIYRFIAGSLKDQEDYIWQYFKI